MNIALFDPYTRKKVQEEPTVLLMDIYKEIKQRGYNSGRTAAHGHLHGHLNRTPRFPLPRLPDLFYAPSGILTIAA